MVRFVNSGTEAVMSAIRLARAYTNRTKIIKFRGCYHGHVDALLVKAGSGAATLGIPDSPGVTEANTANTLIADYNDLASVKALFEQHGDDIAAILVEPVAGNMGCIPPSVEFLPGLREIASSNSALLVFDEVMTGFRVAYGGAQARYNVLPDITTLGKIVGGCLPVGAYGASADIMKTVAPAGPMYQAGTLSGNPLAMGAGLATLTALRDTANLYQDLEQSTAMLLDGMKRIANELNVPLTTTQVGAMFSAFYNPNPINTVDDVLASDAQRFNKVFHQLLANGVYIAPSAFEAGFMSTANTPEVIEQTLAAYQAALKATV